MTPEERQNRDKIERQLRKRIESLMRSMEHPPKNPSPIYQEHVAEQMDALAEDVKTGRAFAGPEWKIDTKDGIILLPERGREQDMIDALPKYYAAWLLRRKRVRRLQLVALWLALLFMLGLAAIFIFK